MFTTLPLELFVCREVLFFFLLKDRARGDDDVWPPQVIEQYFFSHEAFNMQRHLFFTTAILFASMLSAHTSILPTFSAV
jgi:sodium-coupled neutral amino acid transporter 11